ncbi:MAG: tetratricopeptide repeat protein [Lachnospiraceae bacterium]|nr:tetratricopeptide repeat protein [Lachnospiraceae bacterium]
MRCIRCQTELTESPFCPGCGCDVTIQKRSWLVSDMYYNHGLEKAEIRDLSGAVDLLVRSLKFNKRNIQARNLLGLVYFEMGEAVAAMSEWIISANLQTSGNIASEYIERLKANANKLDTINLSIKSYNEALSTCRNGHTDTAAIQLKKVLSQNPKLIKGYHLLALIYMKDGEYKKARRILKKAARIDKTNSTTLRFMKEIDEQTGSSGRREFVWPSFGRKPSAQEVQENAPEIFLSDNDVVIQPPAFRESSVLATLINLCFGLAVGAAVVWFLVVPANTQNISQDANEKVVEYSNTMASQSSEITKLRSQISESQETVASATAQIETATAQVTSYENLLKAYNAYQEENYDSVANVFGNIDTSVLSVDGRMLYNTIYDRVSSYMFDTYKDTGISAYLSGDYQQAVENLTKAMEIQDDDYHVMDYLANAYRYLGMPDEARDIYQKIVDTFPNSSRSENAQSYINAIDRGTDISVEMKNSGQTADIGSLDNDIDSGDGDDAGSGTGGGTGDDDSGTGDDGIGGGTGDDGGIGDGTGDDDDTGGGDGMTPNE